VTYVVFSIVNAVKSMRVSREVELDVPEFGLPAYPENELVDTGEGSRVAA
jgi:hypothetical protein